eukprot:gene4133-biopygen5368
MAQQCRCCRCRCRCSRRAVRSERERQRMCRMFAACLDLQQRGACQSAWQQFFLDAGGTTVYSVFGKGLRSRTLTGPRTIARMNRVHPALTPAKLRHFEELYSQLSEKTGRHRKNWDDCCGEACFVIDGSLYSSLARLRQPLGRPHCTRPPISRVTPPCISEVLPPLTFRDPAGKRAADRAGAFRAGAERMLDAVRGLVTDRTGFEWGCGSSWGMQQTWNDEPPSPGTKQMPTGAGNKCR